MYKICYCLLVLGLLSPHLLVGQQPEAAAELQSNRQMTFTVHLLTDRVDLSKKHAYNGLIGGQKVSLPSPTQFQIQRLWH